MKQSSNIQIINLLQFQQCFAYTGRKLTGKRSLAAPKSRRDQKIAFADVLRSVDIETLLKLEGRNKSRLSKCFKEASQLQEKREE